MEQPKTQECHLFVLVHGLWGGPNHMLTIAKCIKELLSTKLDKKIVILRPSSFRFWKTYDGLKICAERVLFDMFYEIETLKKNNLQVAEISIVGYSLGGLISRYMIGVLEEIGFFNYVKPVFFTTFATPHVGIEFFHDSFFDRTANVLGKYLFGKSGRELFMADNDQLLMQMADPKSRYFRGLERFQKRILLANIKNDRTVAFFTSFITDYCPFDKFNIVRVKYLKNLPTVRIGDVYVRGKIVDFRRSYFEYDLEAVKPPPQEEVSVTRQNKIYKFCTILFGTLFFLPIWVPSILLISFFCSVYSMIKIRVLSYPDFTDLWIRVRDGVFGQKPLSEQDLKIGSQKRDQRHQLETHETFKGDTSGITENAMERMLYVEDKYMGDNNNKIIEEDNSGDQDLLALQPVSSVNSTFHFKSDDDSDYEEYTSTNENITPVKHINLMFSGKKKLFDLDPKLHDEAIATHKEQLSTIDYENYPLFIKEYKLPIKEKKRFIIDNLNSLEWIKMPVFLDAWNAHDGIVARRGPRTNPKGTATIALWVSVLRDHLQEEVDSE